jgi:hypothetical protein
VIVRAEVLGGKAKPISTRFGRNTFVAAVLMMTARSSVLDLKYPIEALLPH